MYKRRLGMFLVLSFFLFSSVANGQEMELEYEKGQKAVESELSDPEMNCTKPIKFTTAQYKRLDYIYYRIYRDYIDLIETYAWAGALTQDQKLLRYKMLNNYITVFHQRKYRWCSEHEPDEWEEEWYNSDNDD
ncbi:DUF2680 domain-containing protein [Peribacillus sp. SCS-155]|uniref:DUF2680 domain-containing protein n=1 Tax=Peribacillus sedimenti TaxID=3115297 RepID=UPI003906195C